MMAAGQIDFSDWNDLDPGVVLTAHNAMPEDRQDLPWTLKR
jgi:hypothetical protein